MLSLHTQDIEFLGSDYIGIIFSAVLYGIYLGVYCLSVHAQLVNTNNTRFRRNLYILFSTILLLPNTIFFVANSDFGLQTWITLGRYYPGGPPIFYTNETINSRLLLFGSGAQNVALLLSDSIMIYRCYVVFSSRLYIIALPTLCMLASFALGVTIIPLWYDEGISSSINAIGIALNTVASVMITAMISAKILFVSRSLGGCIESQTARTKAYTNIIAILVESAVPSAILGIIASITQFLDVNNLPASTYPFELLVGPCAPQIWSLFTALSPQLIIYRVARGSAWTETTSEELTRATGTIHFAPREANTEVFAPACGEEGSTIEV